MRPADRRTMDLGITKRAVAMERTMSLQVTPLPVLICLSPKGVPAHSLEASEAW